MLLHRPFPILAAALLAACNQNLAPEADGPQAGAADARQVKLGSADARRVDPATLMPDPVLASDPDTDWDCRTVGAGVKCVGHKTTIEEGIDIGTL